jgi:2-polyprenyl-3-methyl-5-hydroxy-6-metoxy-1,4-benzoquinol methylase
MDSLKLMLEVDNLTGRNFLDVGSGSGLFSLAARRLGAKVHSFDYDPNSVACTLELKCRYFDRDDNGSIEEGSVLVEAFMESLGKYDIEYSWGVLHHTGELWKVLNHVEKNVALGCKLFIALYNDQGGASRRWLWVKTIYNKLPSVLRAP